MNKQAMKYIAIFSISLCCVLFPCLVLLFTGIATPFISSFAVDDFERIYIGGTNDIFVYENGKQIRTIDPHTSRSYVFTISKEGNILLSTSTKMYIMDLDGSILDVQEDVGAQVYNQIQYQRQDFTCANGNVYKMTGYWGWTQITKNNTETVYRISILSFVVKILMAVCAIALIIFPIWITKKLSWR